MLQNLHRNIQNPNLPFVLILYYLVGQFKSFFNTYGGLETSLRGGMNFHPKKSKKRGCCPKYNPQQPDEALNDLSQPSLSLHAAGDKSLESL